MNIAVPLLGLLCGYYIGGSLRASPLKKPPGADGVLAYHYDPENADANRENANNDVAYGALRRGKTHPRRSLLTIPKEEIDCYETIGDDGRLTWGIRELAGLTEEGSQKAQATIDRAWGEWSELAAGNTTYVASESDPSQNVWVYKTKAFKAEGIKIWENMSAELKRDLGEQSTKILLDGFHPYQYFFDLGSFDAKFTHFTETKGYRHPMVSIEVIDPSSGKILKTGQRDPSNLPRCYQSFVKFPPP